MRGTPAIHYLEGNGGHIVSSCLSGLSFSICHLSSPRHWSNITPQPQLQQTGKYCLLKVSNLSGRNRPTCNLQSHWQCGRISEGSLLLACARVPVCPCARVPVCPCARVPVCPCARGSGLCPGARVPVCPCARASDVLAKCYTDFVQSRSDTLAGSCSLSFGSPNSLSILRGSYGRCKGRCLIWVLTLVSAFYL